eukprot:8795071-Pyramimonas_sp.AAC.1
MAATFCCHVAKLRRSHARVGGRAVRPLSGALGGGPRGEPSGEPRGTGATPRWPRGPAGSCHP